MGLGAQGQNVNSGNRGSSWKYEFSVLEALSQIASNTLAGASNDHELRVTSYKANKPGVGYSTGDFITRTDIIFVPTGVIISTLWFNETTGLTILPPPIADLDPFIPPSAVTVSNLPAALGQALMAGSLSVAIASNQSTLPVDLPTTIRTPSLARAIIAGVVAAGARSVSVYNAGTTAGTWLGASIEPGKQFTYSAGGENDTLSAFAYTASATAILVITTIV